MSLDGIHELMRLFSIGVEVFFTVAVLGATAVITYNIWFRR